MRECRAATLLKLDTYVRPIRHVLFSIDLNVLCEINEHERHAMAVCSFSMRCVLAHGREAQDNNNNAVRNGRDR